MEETNEIHKELIIMKQIFELMKDCDREQKKSILKSCLYVLDDTIEIIEEED